MILEAQSYSVSDTNLENLFPSWLSWKSKWVQILNAILKRLDVHVWSFYRLLPRSSYIEMLEEIPDSQSRFLQFYLGWTQSDWHILRKTVTWGLSRIFLPGPRFFLHEGKYFFEIRASSKQLSIGNDIIFRWISLHDS